MEVRYQKGATGVDDTDRWPSPIIWGAYEEELARPGRSVQLWDDFDNVPVTPTISSQAGYGGKFKAYNTGSGTVAGVTSFNSTETGGGILGINTDTAGDQGVIAQVANPFRLSGLASGKPLMFEVRMAITQIVTNDAQYFVGLGETDAMTIGAAVPLADANACSNTGAMIGFQREEDGLGVLKTVYADRATSWTAIDSTAGTVAALTWTKLGMLWTPDKVNRNGDNLSFFQDGVLLDTGLTNAEIAALTNLDANNLGFIAAIFADSAGTSSYLYLDWVRVAQLL